MTLPGYAVRAIRHTLDRLPPHLRQGDSGRLPRQRGSSGSQRAIRGRSRVPRPCCPMPKSDAGMSYEVDPEYPEHTRREALDEQDQPELPWDD